MIEDKYIEVVYIMEQAEKKIKSCDDFKEQIAIRSAAYEVIKHIMKGDEEYEKCDIQKTNGTGN